MYTRFLMMTLCLGLFAMPAMAYIDPGSGSAILSALAGLIVASVMAVKGYWYKIKSFFIKPPKKDPNNPPAQ